MRTLKSAALVVATIFGVLWQPAAAQITPFTMTNNGLTVTFTSSPTSDAFLVSDLIPFVSLQNNTLIELFDSDNELMMSFSRPVAALQLDFALSGNWPSDLTYVALTGGLGGAVVDSGMALGTPPFPGNAEGRLQFTAAAFDTIVLGTFDPDPHFHAGAFAIDNLLVTTASPATSHLFTFDAPEPVTLALFGAGLIGMGGALRRRRKMA